jgi:hypothetical protein
MKKVLEEEIMTRNSYATIVEIHVGEFGTTTSFWPKVLETVKETNVFVVYTVHPFKIMKT